MICFATLGDEGRAPCFQDVAVNEVVRRVANEGTPAIGFGENTGRVNDGTARRSNETAGHQFSRREALSVGPFRSAFGAFDAPGLKLTDAVDLAGRVVIGNVERDGTDRQR